MRNRSSVALLGALALMLSPARPIGAAEVRLTSADADVTGGAPTVLTGDYTVPESPGPFPGIVALHGCGGLFGRTGTLSKRHEQWRRLLVADGYAVLFVDSFTSRGLREICTVRNRTVSPGRERVRDAWGGVAFLASRPEIDRSRLAILGWSNGGSTVLRAVDGAHPAYPKEAAAVIPRLAIAFYPGCRPVAGAGRPFLPAVPLTILIGEDDDWTPVAPCRTLVERAASPDRLRMITYPGAVHDFDSPDTPLRVRTGIATTASGTATTGTHEPSRVSAIAEVRALLARTLKP